MFMIEDKTTPNTNKRTDAVDGRGGVGYVLRNPDADRGYITSTPKSAQISKKQPKKGKSERGFLYTPSQKRRTPLPGVPENTIFGPVFCPILCHFYPPQPYNTPR